jgi:iron complex outermembrane receptor protein
MRYRVYLALTTSSAVLAVCASGPALAQAAPPDTAVADTAAEPGERGEIVVTGSRIARTDYTATSPVVTVGAEAIENSGAITLEDALNDLPQFQPSSSSVTGGTNTNTPGQATINLRGLGTNRALVLLDGRRLQPSNADGTIDVNTIPDILIQGVETITGGASTAYGSDAISGVVNFKLRHDLEGLRLDAMSGITSRGDGSSLKVSAALGGKFGEGRGRALLALTYSERGTILNGSRSFFDDSPGIVFPPQGTVAFGNNVPSQAAVDRVFARYGFPAGSVVRTEGLSFNNDGTLWNNAPVTRPIVNYRADPPGLVSFVNNTALSDTDDGSFLSFPLKRYNAYGEVGYEVADGIEVYSNINFVNYTAIRRFGAPNLGGMGTAATIPVTNPFIPSDLREILASRANPNAPFQLNKNFTETGLRGEKDTFTVYQIIAGLRGDLFADWDYDVFGSVGRTEFGAFHRNVPQLSRIQTLFNAPDGGRSLCQGGFNPFGVFRLSASCQDYLIADTKNSTILTQKMAEANFEGPVFALPAGTVRLAVGAAYRKNSYEFLPDPLIATLDIVGFPRAVGAKGEVDVREGYAEVLIPVLRDISLIQELNIGLAYRYSDYSSVGGVSTYKADFDWSPFSAIRIRGGYQRAIRAPSLSELFSSPIGVNSQIGAPTSNGAPAPTGDPCDIRTIYRNGPNAAQVRALCVVQGVPEARVDSFTRGGGNSTSVLNQGNPNLNEETADTYSLGLVWRSPAPGPLLSGLSGSVDYYRIKLQDAVGLFTIGTYLPRCFNIDGSNPSYSNANQNCLNVRRDPVSGDLNQSLQPLFNLGSYLVSGIDVQVDWRAALSDVGLTGLGQLRLNVVASYLDEFKIQNFVGGPVFDFADVVNNPALTGSLPKWKAVTSLNYSQGIFDVGVRWRYIDGMRDTTRVTTPGSTTPGVPAYHYFDLNLRADVAESMTLRAGITNLFDKGPPIVGGQVGSTEPRTYDVIGRSFFVGVQARF